MTDDTKRYPTSVALNKGEKRMLDRIVAQAKEIDPDHPYGARSNVIQFAIHYLAKTPDAIESLLSGEFDDVR